MDIDKLKALALAYAYENGEHWYNAHELADGTTYEPGVNFIMECSPATVLELIAENERLRTDAERYRILRAHIKPGDVQLAMTRLPPKGQTPEQRIDMLCDLYAGAHTQAGKPTQEEEGV